jgi:hypothetical protein
VHRKPTTDADFAAANSLAAAAPLAVQLSSTVLKSTPIAWAASPRPPRSACRGSPTVGQGCGNADQRRLRVLAPLAAKSQTSAAMIVIVGRIRAKKSSAPVIVAGTFPPRPKGCLALVQHANLGYMPSTSLVANRMPQYSAWDLTGKSPVLKKNDIGLQAYRDDGPFAGHVRLSPRMVPQAKARPS